MLDTERRIAEWRLALAEAIGPDPVVLDELESHLRDEIDHLQMQGETLEHAVTLAIEKVGPAEMLAAEFAKIARPWWPIRIVLAGTAVVLISFLGLIGYTAAQRPWDSWLTVHVAAVTTGYLLSYAIGLLCVCYAGRRMIADLTIGQQTSWRRALFGLNIVAFALTSTGMILGSIWAYERWGRFWSCDLRETGALLTLAWQAILLTLLSRSQASRWPMCWGMLGNVSVTFAWFVANVLTTETQLHSYGFNRTLILSSFVLIALTHGLLFVTGVAPSIWLRLRKRDPGARSQGA